MSNWAVAQEAENPPKKITSELLLPANTKAWISIPDIDSLDEDFLKTQIGALTQEESLKPFFDSAKTQFRELLKAHNLRLGVKMDNVRDIQSGEICLAGITSDIKGKPGALGRGSHGMVFLVDVNKTEEAAKDLLKNIEKEMVARGAVRQDSSEIHGAKINKWKLKNKRLKKPKFAFQTISNGWLLASDNENIFREVLRRLAFFDQIKPNESLKSQTAFKNVAENTKFHELNAPPHVRWFVDPFGYVELANAIADEEQEFKQRRNDWMGVLKKVGFDSIQGAGGSVAFHVEEHEILHRSYVYMPKGDKALEKQSVRGLFDFENKNQATLIPPAFVPNDSSGFFAGTWDMAKALKNVGRVFDAFLKDEGAFENIVKELALQMEVDVKEVMKKFANEIIVVAESQQPVSEDSERIMFAIKINGDAEFVFKNVQKAFPDSREIKIAGFNALRIDAEEVVDPLDDPFGQPDFGDDDDEEEEEEEAQLHLLKKKIVVIKDNYLFLANDEQYLADVLLKKHQTELRNARDFARVTKALAKLSQQDRVSFRQFARTDRVLRTNYEMIRQGKMGASQTFLARLLNKAFSKQNANDDGPRAQKIKGAKLPEDYEKIARYLGPSGWVMETTEDGWLATGCVLKKTNREAVANKANNKPGPIRND